MAFCASCTGRKESKTWPATYGLSMSFSPMPVQHILLPRGSVIMHCWYKSGPVGWVLNLFSIRVINGLQGSHSATDLIATSCKRRSDGQGTQATNNRLSSTHNKSRPLHNSNFTALPRYLSHTQQHPDQVEPCAFSGIFLVSFSH